MDNYKETDYAKNKYSHNIVYETASGTVEITVTQYLNENPNKEEADFWELKALSDEVYRQQAKEEHTQTNRNARFDENIESGFFYFPSPQEILEFREERLREQRLVEELLFPLTPAQRRRLLCYVVEGMSLQEIADMENVNPSAVCRSIIEAKRKLRRRFGV
jgi:DNA-directed RNA polymerase specialized sigma24 family protein